MKKLFFTMGMLLSASVGFSQTEVSLRSSTALVSSKNIFGRGELIGVGVSFNRWWGIEGEFLFANVYDKTTTSSYDANKYGLYFVLEEVDKNSAEYRSAFKIGGAYVQKPNKGKFGAELGYLIEVPCILESKRLFLTAEASAMLGGFDTVSGTFAMGIKYNIPISKK